MSFFANPFSFGETWPWFGYLVFNKFFEGVGDLQLPRVWCGVAKLAKIVGCIPGGLLRKPGQLISDEP